MGTSSQIIVVKQIMIHMSHMIHMQSSLLMFKENFRLSAKRGEIHPGREVELPICTAFD